MSEVHPTRRSLSRRVFLAGVGALAAGSLLGCGSSGSPSDAGLDPTPVAGTVAWRLTGRGKRVSNAAKANNANKRFATRAAALAGRAHPGDGSQAVPISVTTATWTVWFGSGAPVFDLRHA